MESAGTQWVGTRDAAHALGVTYRKVYTLIERGELPAYKVGSDIKLLRAEVDAYRQDRLGT
ncbi:MAG: helix-turn-helix domain-containing protein [Actinobacteria bacterium]|nr:helix-turn-helix domain-containing protein [Actinomycetota bacterium]